MESRVRRLSVSLLVTPKGVHLTALVVVAVVLVAAASKSWFFYDDWSFLVPSQDNIWAPHVGHWSTTPFLLFRGIRDVFGLNSYVPFALPVIIAQLGLSHLIWRFCLRVGVTPWISTTFSVLLLLFGAGSENVLWAFQVGFVGAMSLSMVVVMLVMKDQLRTIDVIVIILASTIALSCSGSSIPVLIMAAVIGFTRHGFARSLAVFALPALAYVVWFALIGRTAPPAGRAEGLTQTLYGVPTFAISMLTDGLGRAVPVPVLGTLIFLAVSIWGVFTYQRASRATRPAYLLFLAAPFFALLTGYSRVGLGADTATSSRYLFFVIPMMLPLMGLAMDAAVTRASLPLGGVIFLLVIIVIYNAGGLVGSLATRDSRSENTRERLSAAAALESSYPTADPDSRPGGQWAPDVLLSDLETFQAKGWFTPGSYDTAAALTARTALGLSVASVSAPAASARCTAFPADGSAATFSGDEVLVEAPAQTSLGVRLTGSSSSGDVQSVVVPAGASLIQLKGGLPSGASLAVTSQQSGPRFCSSP